MNLSQSGGVILMKNIGYAYKNYSILKNERMELKL